MRRAYQKPSIRASTKSLHRPMGNCCSNTDAPVEVEVTLDSDQILTVVPPLVDVVPRSSQPSGTVPGKVPGRKSPQVGIISLHELPPRRRVKSAPQKMWFTMDGVDFPMLPLAVRRSRAKSYVAPSAGKSASSSMSAEHSRTSPRRLTLSFPVHKPLNSTVRQMLPEHFRCILRHYQAPILTHNYILTRFRVLVVGKVRTCFTQASVCQI
ncbi:hypothetical protein EI94DRAFT_75765 [Lactarius quietus]|nr:hypothetical protein EI94DRAFT_75765 [Lactarius quietus]